jgi:hypothetical protein
LVLQSGKKRSHSEEGEQASEEVSGRTSWKGARFKSTYHMGLFLDPADKNHEAQAKGLERIDEGGHQDEVSGSKQC